MAEIFGTTKNDLLFGTPEDDLINALEGNDDVVSAGAGNDTVFGGQGEENIFGAEGDDYAPRSLRIAFLVRQEPTIFGAGLATTLLTVVRELMF